MEARVWFHCLLLLKFWEQRSSQTAAISLSDGAAGLSLSEAHQKFSGMSQSNPDAHLIRSKPHIQARPYSLSLSTDDYHYFPKPKNLRVPRLLKLLGSSYDPFWMSLEDPRGRNTSREDLGALSQDLAERTDRFRKKLLQKAEVLDIPELLTSEDGVPQSQNLSRAFIHRLHQWLVESATCHLTSSWVDLGPIFWPRWVRHTDCDLTQAGCSWPPGMTCRPAQVTHIKLLAWHCWVNRDHTLSTGKFLQQCTWRQIPYPVVAVCKCSCR